METLKEAIREANDETDEDGTEEEEAGDTDEPEAAAAPPANEPVDMEKLMRQMDKLADRHRTAVLKALQGDITGLAPCPLCVPNMPGYVLHPRPMPADEQTRQAVAIALGDPATVELRYLENDEECPTCGGHGRLKTHSRAVGHTEQPCMTCSATGHRTKPVQAAPVAPLYPVTPTQPPPAPARVYADPPLDQWGRGVGHPHYGIPPAAIVA